MSADEEQRFEPSALVRLVIGTQWVTKIVQGRDLPAPGDVIELEDGRRVIVSEIRPSEGNGVAAEIIAKLAP